MLTLQKYDVVTTEQSLVIIQWWHCNCQCQCQQWSPNTQPPDPAYCRLPYTFCCQTNTVSTNSYHRLCEAFLQLFCANNLD